MNRRLFLSLVAAGAAWSTMARATPRPPGALTRLRLVNAHTGETFEGSYRDGKGPIDRVMDELCTFLRDHHSGEKTQIDVGIIDFLADVLDSVGETRATVLSAYRTPETNAMLARTNFGVAEHSQHMFGRALDIRPESRLPDAMSKARGMQRGGVGWYPHSGFIHIDTGPVRNWTLDEHGLDGLLQLGGHRKPDGLMVFDGRRKLDGKGGGVLLGGPWRPLTVPERIVRQRQLARAEFLARAGGLRLTP